MAGDFDSISNRLITQSGFTQKALSKSFERLSSGLRINSASDDAAALSLADKLKTRGTNLAIAYRNANDSISLLNVASSAVDELSLIVTRMQELATRASTGGLSGSQRVALDEEAAALTDEYNRVASTTEYNTQHLFGSTAYSSSEHVGDTVWGSVRFLLSWGESRVLWRGMGRLRHQRLLLLGITRTQ